MSGLQRKSTVYGLNGRRVRNVIYLSTGTYESTIQRSRNFHALFTGTLEDCFQIMGTAVLIHPQKPMKPGPRAEETAVCRRGRKNDCFSEPDVNRGPSSLCFQVPFGDGS